MIALKEIVILRRARGARLEGRTALIQRKPRHYACGRGLTATGFA
jgi:hypothetical protein